MVGMGSVVTRDVPDFHLVVGNPARSIGAVCRCGYPIAKWPAGQPQDQAIVVGCMKCTREYRIENGAVAELPPVSPAASAPDATLAVTPS